MREYCLSLPSLGPCVVEVTFETKLRWKLRETIAGVHLDAPVLTAFAVGRLESSFVSWAMESEELVEAITKTFESTLGAIHESKGPSCLAATSV